MATPDFEQLASGIYLEGLAIEADGETVWYSDVIAGGLRRRGRDGAHGTFLPGRMWIGGIAVNANGHILSTGAGGLQWLDPATGASGWVLDQIGGARINGINEIAPDGQGGIYFGTLDLDSILAGQRTGPVALYHLAPDGAVREMCRDIGFANGMALSPDGRALYCNESFDGTYVHDVAPDGSLVNRRLLLAKPDCDGMAIDEAGNLWITGFASSHIDRIAPDGTMLEPFATPGEAVTQLRFGGADLRDVYLVTVPADAGARLAKGDLPTEDISFLYCGRSDIAGHRVPAITLPTG